MRGTTRTVAVAALSAVALLAAGCGSGDDGETDTPAADAKTGGEITVRGCTPENPLIPSNTTETCGGTVIDAVFSKLVHYDSETAAPQNDIAESIETEDNQTFTVKLKQGYKFHDGTEVKAKNFVDTWNYAAYGPNAQSSGYFMEPIEGYADLQCAGTANPDDPCEGCTPKAKEMSGLKVVDDNTFTIKTPRRSRTCPVRLGYSAFAPLPESFFEDPEAFGQKPIGNGPFKLESWTKNQSIVLSKFADYTGERRPRSTRSTSRSTRTPTPPTRTSSPTTSTSPTRSRRARWSTTSTRRTSATATRRRRTASSRRSPSRRPGRPELRRPEGPPGHLDGDRPRHDHQADLQRHPRPGHRLGLPGRGRLQGRPVRRVLHVRRRQGQGPARRRPAASRATRSPSPTTLTARTRTWVEAICNSIKQTLGVECAAVGVAGLRHLPSTQVARPRR